LRHHAREPEANLRTVLQRPARRHRPGPFPLAELCAAVGRRHPCREHARPGIDVRDCAPEADGMKNTATILLVDDDSAFRHVMAGELRRMGHDVSTATSGEEAVTSVEQQEPEIVLLDLRLPGMDGLETLKAIRARSASIEVI